MGVIFRVFGGSARSTPFNLWTDFDHVQVIATARANYFHNHSEANGVNPNTWVMAADSIQINCQGGGGATFGYASWLPAQLGGALSRSQFCESIYAQDTGILGNTSRAGWCVMVGSDGRIPAIGTNHGYHLMTLHETNQFRLDRFVNGVITPLATFAEAAIGSKVALTADISVPGQTTVQVYDDEVVIQTFVDNLVPQNTGLPGLWSRDFTAGRIVGFRNLRCGVLSKLGY